MPERQLEALMWAQACEAMERAERLHRQFFHRGHATPYWEAPCDIFETDDTLTILIALPGVEVDQIKVTMSAGVLMVSGERPLPQQMAKARALIVMDTLLSERTVTLSMFEPSELPSKPLRFA